MNKYYPEFYRKRRQKQEAYLRITKIVVVIAVIGLGAVSGIYIFNNFLAHRHSDARANPQLANEKHDLEIQSRMDKPADQPLGATGAIDPDLSKTKVDTKLLAYSESYPSVNVGLAGLSSPTAGADAANAAPDATPPATDGTAGAEGPPATGTPMPADSPPATDTPASSPGPTPAAPSAVIKPADDAAANQAKIDEQKKKDQAALDKAQAKKDAADKAAKLKEKQAAEAKKDKDKPTDAPTPPAVKPDSVPLKTQFRVYAGKFLTKSDAEKGKSDLAAVGLSGSIIDTKAGDFLLLVGTVDDYDNASALKGKLSSSGFGGAFVTKKSVPAK